MIQPFLELGLRVAFYPVESDLSLSPAKICERIDAHVLAVMLMHYFGFPQPTDVVSVLATQYPHLLAIEDRTHMLLSDLYTGNGASNTAIAIYSARKWGPFPDLGIVLWPGQNPTAPDRGYDWTFGLTRLLVVLLRALFLAWPTETLRKLSLRVYHRAEVILDQRVQIRHASPVSRLLWRYWDWMTTFQVRRENYQYLLDNWPCKGIKPLFEVLSESVCPLGFPVCTIERDELKQRLVAAGVFPPIHWPSPPQLLPGEFPEVDVIVAQELTIPVDQRYGTEHMDRILEVLAHG
jgi:dTDP-4-amino-4,6-dideoxygalactose transaminase